MITIEDAIAFFSNINDDNNARNLYIVVMLMS